MKNSNEKARVLAYQTSQVLEKETLNQVHGGAAQSTTGLTTKETVDTYGNWDVGFDYQW